MALRAGRFMSLPTVSAYCSPLFFFVPAAINLDALADINILSFKAFC